MRQYNDFDFGGMNMKKFIAIVISLVLMVSCAVAECGCTVTDIEKKVIYDMVSIEGIVSKEEDSEAIFKVISSGDIECSVARRSVMNVFLTNYSIIANRFSDVQMEVMISYITKCCCGEVVNSVNKQVNSVNKTSCQHTGGNHANGGVCTKCGKVYQEHTLSSWQCTDNTWHNKLCACGEKIECQYHQWDGKDYGTENGMQKRYCIVCCEFYYVYVKADSCGCNCGNCADECCVGCFCGCHS